VCSLCCLLTQFSILYTAVDTPAEGDVHDVYVIDDDDVVYWYSIQ
jgi:hypothetical protein